MWRPASPCVGFTGDDRRVTSGRSERLVKVLPPAAAAVDLRNQLLDRVLVRHERQAPTGERGGQQAADRVVDRRHAPLAEGIVGHADRGVERQAVACIDDLCDVRLAARHLAVEDAGEHL